MKFLLPCFAFVLTITLSWADPAKTDPAKDTPKDPAKTEPAKKEPDAKAEKPDGSSYEKAIVVGSVEEEYRWLAKNFPGYKMERQALSQNKGKPYDILFFTAKGEKKSIYFDISSFFGKR